MTINPYLNFNGNCEQAFNYYQKVFGTEFQSFMKFKEMPEDPNMKILEEDKDKIMHVSLPIGEGNVLMGSDTSENFGNTVQIGNNFSISLNLNDTTEADRIFNALSTGGNIVMPMQNTFWNSYYGILVDPFGIQWMINCALDQ